MSNKKKASKRQDSSQKSSSKRQARVVARTNVDGECVFNALLAGLVGLNKVDGNGQPQNFQSHEALLRYIRKKVERKERDPTKSSSSTTTRDGAEAVESLEIGGDAETVEPGDDVADEKDRKIENFAEIFFSKKSPEIFLKWTPAKSTSCDRSRELAAAESSTAESSAAKSSSATDTKPSC
jgi:hypothetical protein